MRVLHVIRDLDPDSGGPPVVAMRLAAAEAALGHAVTVLTQVRHGREEAVRKFVAQTPGGEAVRLELCPIHSGISETLAIHARRRAPALLRDADVLHAHGVWVALLLAATSRARKLGVPYVLTSHSALDAYCMAQKRWKKRAAMALGVRTMLRGARALIAATVLEKREFGTLELDVPTTAIPHGIDPDELARLPRPGAFRARHPELGDRRYVVFVGRLHAIKGLDVLLEAMARYVRQGGAMDAVLVGPDGGEGQALRRRTAELGLEQRVHQVGAVYGPERWEALVDAAAAVHPSRYESFGLAIVEALAAGLPTLVSDRCHLAGELRDAGAALTTALTPDALAAGLRQLDTDDDLRQSLAQRGPALVRERFNWPAVARRTVDVYQHALRGGG